MTSTTSAERRAFWGVSALLFAARAAGTIGWCASMSGSAAALLGIALFPLGLAPASLEMRRWPVARAVPLAVGAVVLLAGLLQLTAWKARQPACCRESPGRGGTLPADARPPGDMACASASSAAAAVAA
jgi:hypothetical protein